jgi:hypothetical protein
MGTTRGVNEIMGFAMTKTAFVRFRRISTKLATGLGGSSETPAGPL